MTLLVIGIVLGLGALVVLVFFVLAPPAPRVPLARRMAPGEAHVGLLEKASTRTLDAVERAVRGRSRLFSADDLELAGVRSSPSGYLLATTVVAIVLAGIGALLGFGSLWSIVLATLFAGLAVLGAKIVLVVRASARRAKFTEQLDDTLQLLSGNLRAGYGLAQSIDAVSRNAEEPTTTEFARIINESRLGRDLGDALAATATRMRSDDFEWVAQAIGINHETGGNLAEVLQQVGATIRERSQIRRQVRALSAEGRLSAIVLIVLPLAVFGLVMIISPGYLSFFFGSVFGVIAIMVAVVLLVVGSVWMLAVTRVRF